MFCGLVKFQSHVFYLLGYERVAEGDDSDHGRLSFYTEMLLYMVSPYDYYYYVKTLTTYFRHLEFKIRFDFFINLNLAKFLCIITTYHIIKHFELL